MADINALIANPQVPQVNLGAAAQGANQIMQLRQNQQKMQEANALRGILSEPGAIDPETGQLKPESLQKVMGVAPQIGMELQQNGLAMQQKRLQLDAMKTKSAYDNAEYIGDKMASVYETYADSVKDGKTSPDKALSDARQAWSKTLEEMKTSGVVGPDVLKHVPTAFDPKDFHGRIQNNKSFRDWNKEQRQVDKDKDQGWETLTDPTTNQQYQHKRGTGLNETMSGEPYTPGGAQKLAGPRVESPGAKVEADAETIAKVERKKAQNQTITPEEQSAADDAAARQKARSAPKVAEAGETAVARDAAKHIPDDVSRNIAEQYVETGNPMVLAGFRRSPAMIAQIEGDILKAQKDRGMTPRDVARQSADFAAYTQGVKAFEAGGRLEPVVRSQNVAVQHLSVLQDAADALQNKNFTLFNGLKNKIAELTGEEAPTDFNGVKRIVGTELVKAITGSAGALGDREALDADLKGANSEKQLVSLINKYKKLMAGQLSGLRQSYDRLETGRPFDERFLAPETQREMKKLAPRDGDKKTAAPSGTPDQVATTQAAANEPPPEAIAVLKANPGAAAQFEATFHLKTGDAQKYLGGAAQQPAPSQPDRTPPAPASARPNIENMQSATGPGGKKIYWDGKAWINPDGTPYKP